MLMPLMTHSNSRPFRSLSLWFSRDYSQPFTINHQSLIEETLNGILQSERRDLETLRIEVHSQDGLDLIYKLRLSPQLRELPLEMGRYHMDYAPRDSGLLTGENAKALEAGESLRSLTLRQPKPPEGHEYLTAFTHLTFLSIDISRPGFASFTAALAN